MEKCYQTSLTVVAALSWDVLVACIATDPQTYFKTFGGTCEACEVEERVASDAC